MNKIGRELGKVEWAILTLFHTFLSQWAGSNGAISPQFWRPSKRRPLGSLFICPTATPLVEPPEPHPSFRCGNKILAVHRHIRNLISSHSLSIYLSISRSIFWASGTIAKTFYSAPICILLDPLQLGGTLSVHPNLS